MATYLQGSTDYIPEIQEFRPDFNFYNKALQMRQSKYDAAHDKLSTLYGSLLNSPMLREKNIEERDQFFKTIEQDIKKMASLDLSKQQNLQAASTVFNQLLDNKNIVRDMTWTKNWQREHQRADAFRNCTDIEKCGGAWWQGGVDDLNYQAEEFRNASDQDAMNFSGARFTPYQDIMGMAVKLAKEADLNVSWDQRIGNYIYTTKNGKLIQKPLFTLFAGKIGRDPKVIDYLTTKARNTRRGWVKSNAAQYGSEEAALNEYIRQRAQDIGYKLPKQEESNNFTKENIAQQKQELDNRAKNGKLPYTGQKLIDIYNKLGEVEESVTATGEVIKNAKSSYDNAVLNRFSGSSIKNLDAALALNELEVELANAAVNLSMRGAELKMKADPFAVENVRQANRMAMEDLRHEHNLEALGKKFQLDRYGKYLDMQGAMFQNQVLDIEAGAGATDIPDPDDENAQFKYYENLKKQFEDGLSAAEKSIVIPTIQAMQKQSKEKGGLANEDLIDVTQTMLEALADSENYKTAQDETGLSRSYRKKLSNWNKMSKEEQLRWARNEDFAKLDSLKGSIIDSIYDKSIEPLYNMKDDYNTVVRDYLQGLYKNTADARMNIKLKNKHLDLVNDANRQSTQDVKDAMRKSGKHDDFMPYIDMFIDENGHMKSKTAFGREYADNNIDKGTTVQEEKFFGGLYEGGQEPTFALTNELEAQNRNERYKNLVELGMQIYDRNIEAVETDWKAAFGTYLTNNDKTGVLKGFGAQAIAKAQQMPITDPSTPLATPTKVFNQYMNDFFSADSQNARISLGGMEETLPEAGSNQDLLPILRQIVTDFRTRNSAKDKNRPIVNGTYQGIAGGDENWSAYNIKVPANYVKQYIGSKDAPGLFRSIATKLSTDGITVYMNKDKSTNIMDKSMGKSDLENLMELTNGVYEFDEYPEFFSDVKLIKQGNKYISDGTAMVVDEKTGQVTTQPMKYYTGLKADNVYDHMMKDMAVVTEMNKMILQNYNATKGVAQNQ